MDISDACHAACPRARAQLAAYIARMSEEPDRRLQQRGEMRPRPGGALAAICCVGSETACSLEAAVLDSPLGMPEMVAACSRETMRDFVRSRYSDNFTACEGNCTGALDVMADVTSIHMDITSRTNTPSARDLARLRQRYCSSRDVVECAVLPNGAGLSACNDDDDEGGGADPTGPAQLLAQCDDALAVVVSMALTVDNPTEFVQDDANKMAVEAGIADAAGVEAEAVEAELSVRSSRRLLQESKRRLQGVVDVAATIHTADASAATALQATVGNINATEMTSAIASAFEDAGIDLTVTVASIEEPAVQTANEAAAEEGTGSGSESNSPSQDGALKASATTGILAVFAVFAVAA